MQEKLRFQQIYEDLKQSMDAGQLKVGDRIPPVTELALKYQVTPATVRRALADLVDQGLVESHVGRGTFVTAPLHLADNPASRPLERTGSGYRLHGANSQEALAGLMALAQDERIIGFTRGMGDHHDPKKAPPLPRGPEGCNG